MVEAFRVIGGKEISGVLEVEGSKCSSSYNDCNTYRERDICFKKCT